MKMSFAVIGATLAFTLVAAAQDVPRTEVFLGYTYLRFNSDFDTFNTPFGIFDPRLDRRSFNANGGSGQFAYNFTNHFSAVLDLGGVTSGDRGRFNRDTTVGSFLLGPRFGKRGGRWRPYGQVLFGGIYAASSVRVNIVPTAIDANGNTIIPDPNLVVRTRLSANEGAFAMTAGGGLDIHVGRHWSVRPIGVDYFLTRIRSSDQNSLRYTAGVNFLFGTR